MRGLMGAPWDETGLRVMIADVIRPGMARFIAAQPFFFIATASATGSCDCSFRGRDYGADGQPLPALVVLDDRRLAFPDFRGNGLFQSLGNLCVNPQIGMLFMDFHRQQRARVNGTARIVAPDRDIWPGAQAMVEVAVQQVYGNCPARIPRMTMLAESDLMWS